LQHLVTQMRTMLQQRGVETAYRFFK
jgi:hypothetical protein